MSTRSPAFTLPTSTSAFQAVSAAEGSAAACRVGQRVGHADQRGRGDDDLLGQPAVMRDAQVETKGMIAEVAACPVDEMGADDAVSGLEGGDAIADRNDLAHAFGHGHAFGGLLAP